MIFDGKGHPGTTLEQDAADGLPGAHTSEGKVAADSRKPPAWPQRLASTVTRAQDFRAIFATFLQNLVANNRDSRHRTSGRRISLSGEWVRDSSTKFKASEYSERTLSRASRSEIQEMALGCGREKNSS